MPLATNVTELNRTNCVGMMLRAFQSNHLVKALIFMPGATDEFYMFHRVKAALTNSSPSLRDAVNALTNQTYIQATFRPPFLLLHTDADPLDPIIHIEHRPTAARFEATRFAQHVIYEDRDWDFVQPMLKKALKADVRPWRSSYDSWHFYRHSLAAWDLTGWEALQAVALAGKTFFTVGRTHEFLVPRAQIIFESDKRVRSAPIPDRLPY